MNKLIKNYIDEEELVEFLKNNLKIQVKSWHKNLIEVSLFLNKNKITSSKCSISQFIQGTGPL